MPVARDRVRVMSSAAILLAALLIFGKVDAAVTRSYDEDFANVTWDTRSWTARWNQTSQAVELPFGKGVSWFALDALTGKTVSDIAFSPSYASDLTGFIGASDGLYRTVDAGSSWSRVLPTANAVTGIALSPAFGGDRTAYAITNGSGFWRSTDGGTSWVQIDVSTNGFGIALSPAYAGDRTVFVAAFDRVLRSTDGGNTWRDVSTGIDASILINGDIRGIAVDTAYATNRTVYISTLGKGVYRSTDAGATWQVANPSAVSVPYATQIAVSANGRIAAIFLSGIYESMDRGTTWTAAYAGTDVNDLAYSKEGDLLIARTGGVYRVLSGKILSLANGWSGGPALVLDVAPTLPEQGSVVAGQDIGARILRAGYAPSGRAESPVTGVDGSPFRVVRATVIPTATLPAETQITYELSVNDAQAAWEGPVPPNVPWEFRAFGSTLRWRATLASSNGSVTPQLHGLVMNFDLDDTLPAPKTVGVVATATSVRWSFEGAAPDVTGYVIERTTDGVIVATTDDPAATFIEEKNLTPNTEHCSRRVYAVRGNGRSPSSEPYVCAVTLAAAAPAPTTAELSSASVRLTMRPGTGNGDDVVYAVHDRVSGSYVAADGVFGTTTPTWRRLTDWANGDVTVVGLVPGVTYQFCVLAQNRAGAVTECAAHTAVTTVSDGGVRGDVSIAVQSTSPAAVAVGDVIPLTVSLAQLGTGVASDITVRVSIPSQGVYVPGSMAVGGSPLTDVLDGDPGDATISTPGALTFRGLTLGVGAKSTLVFAFTATEPVGGFVTIAPTLEYRPVAGLALRTVAAAPLTFDVVGGGVRTESEQPPPPAEPPRETSPPAGAPPTVVLERVPPPPGVSLQPAAPDTGVHLIPEETPRAPSRALELELLEPHMDAVIGSDVITVRGRATAGEVVRVGLDGQSFWTTTAASDGNFALTLHDVAPGSHRVSAILGPLIRDVQMTVTSPPDEAIMITAPLSGAATNAYAVVVSGRGPVVAPVTVAVDGGDVVSGTTTANGGFSVAVPDTLSEGAHRIDVRSVARNGAPLSSTVLLLVDRTPPEPPDIRELRVAKQERDARADAFGVTVELQGTMTAETFASLDTLLLTIASDPVTLAFRPSSPEWSYVTTVALAPGSHTARVAARDRAGNVSPLPETLTFTVAPAACGDGADNDRDGTSDFPADPDCVSSFDPNEATEGAIEQAVSAVVDATSATAKVVAEATDVTAKVAARTAERAAVAVQKQVLDNPTIEVATERVIAPAVVVAVATNTATAVRGFQLLAYGQYLVSIILSPSRLLGRRKRKGWGTVYASLSKRPVDLATVRLHDATGRVVQTAVTDHLGRYSFQVKRAGSYRIAVQHVRHVFPSVQLRGKREDAVFTDLYHGDIFVVPEGAFIAKNIPVDLREGGTETNQQAIWKRYGRIVSGAVSDGGLVLSVGAFAVSPQPYVGGILAVNLVFYVLFRRLAKQTRAPRSWGSVIDALTSHPLHLAVVRLFDVEFSKLLETAATDRHGRYRFLVGRSVYYVTAQKQGYDPGRSKTIDLTKGEGMVGETLELVPTARASGTALRTETPPPSLPAAIPGAPAIYAGTSPQHASPVADSGERALPVRDVAPAPPPTPPEDHP